MKKFLNCLLLAGAAAGMPALAGTGGLYVPFGGMIYDYDDSQRGLDTNLMPTLGLGWRFDDQFAVELMAARGKTDMNVPALNLDATVTHYRLDGLVFFGDRDGFRPYVVGGIGENRIKYDLIGTHRDTLLNAGVGLSRSLGERWSLRGDIRALYSLDEKQTEAAFNLLAQYQFGSVRRPSSTATPAPTPAPAPVLAVDGDDDGDGVPNSVDRCPNTPSGRTVNQYGCEPTIEKEVSIELKVLFDTDSAAIRPEHRSEIAQVARFLEQHEQVSVRIEGHTDSRGSAAYNKALSQRRADAVRNALIRDFGGDAGRITAVGYGEERPVASNDTAEGLQKNRRVVAVFR